MSAWDESHEISALAAHVPADSGLRVGLYGGVVLGESTLRAVVAAWGHEFTEASSPADDHVIRYAECVGRYRW